MIRVPKRLGYGIRIILALGTLLLWAGLSSRSDLGQTPPEPTSRLTSGNTPQEMFRYILQDPVPSSVRNLAGTGETWQGYLIYLRFQISSADMETLIASGYKAIDCAAIAHRFTLPETYDPLHPPWNPELSMNAQCYEAKGVKNRWTFNGSHLLMMDPKTEIVYFHGVGA